MYLQADVFARTECTADTTEDELNVVFWQTETVRNLLSVLMKPLRSNMQFDGSTVMTGDCQRGFKSEKCLVLHPDVVGPFDLHFALNRLISAEDALMTKDVAVRVDGAHRFV